MQENEAATVEMLPLILVSIEIKLVLNMAPVWAAVSF